MLDDDDFLLGETRRLVTQVSTQPAVGGLHNGRTSERADGNAVARRAKGFDRFGGQVDADDLRVFEVRQDRLRVIDRLGRRLRFAQAAASHASTLPQAPDTAGPTGGGCQLSADPPLIICVCRYSVR
jgi:hypothetical protein